MSELQKKKKSRKLERVWWREVEEKVDERRVGERDGRGTLYQDLTNHTNHTSTNTHEMSNFHSGSGSGKSYADAHARGVRVGFLGFPMSWSARVL